MSSKVTTTLFRNNRTQAVRLPKAVAFPGVVKEVEIIAIGSSRLICPVGHRWDTYFSRNSRVSDDFLSERDQGTFEEREPL
jgi:antitoxin VapB